MTLVSVFSPRHHDELTQIINVRPPVALSQREFLAPLESLAFGYDRNEQVRIRKSFAIVKFTESDDGSRTVDTSFGNGGMSEEIVLFVGAVGSGSISYLQDVIPYRKHEIVPLPDGSFAVLTHRLLFDTPIGLPPSIFQIPVISLITEEGRLDSDFGSFGSVTIDESYEDLYPNAVQTLDDARVSIAANDIALDGQGNLIIVGSSSHRQTAAELNDGALIYDHAFVHALASDGSSIADYGDDGWIRWDTSVGESLSTITIAKDGSAVFAGLHRFNEILVLQAEADGQLRPIGDPESEGPDFVSVSLTPFDVDEDYLVGRDPATEPIQFFPDDIVIQSDGAAVIGGYILDAAANISDRDAQRFFVLRLNPDYSLDLSFAGTGVVDRAGGSSTISDFQLEILDDDSLLVLSTEGLIDITPSSAFIYRLTADGFLDVSFGEDAEIIHGPGVRELDEGKENLQRLQILDGQIIVSGQLYPNLDFATVTEQNVFDQLAGGLWVTRTFSLETPLSDVSSLDSLPDLRTLDLSNNAIGSIDPVTSASNLVTVDLSGNSITDLTPLRGESVVDSLDAGYAEVGVWSGGDNPGAYAGHYRITVDPNAEATFTFTGVEPGIYQVQIAAPPHPTRTDNARIRVYESSDHSPNVLDQTTILTEGTIDQSLDPEDRIVGPAWHTDAQNLIFTIVDDQGFSGDITVRLDLGDDNSGGLNLVADAVRLVRMRYDDNENLVPARPNFTTLDVRDNPLGRTAYTTTLPELGWRSPTPPRTLEGMSVNDYFAFFVVADAGDVDADGHSDVIVGARGDSSNGNGSGAAYVYSGSSGELIFEFYGADQNASFGSGVAGAGDVDADGFDDVIVGARQSSLGGDNSGAAFIYSGRNGALLRTLAGFSGEDFGTSVAGVGDLDRDGYDDVVVGAPARRLMVFTAGLCGSSAVAMVH